MSPKTKILKILHLLNYFVGIVVVFSALYLYFAEKLLIPLYIALAIIIAGPVESLLNAYINNNPAATEREKKFYLSFVDKVTSLAFLIFLGLAVFAVI